MNMRRFLCLTILCALVSSCGLRAAETPKASENKPNPKSVEWFRKARFGMFIHWGPASLGGQEISWSRGAERPGLPKDDGFDSYNARRVGIPRRVYDNFYLKFNPVKFNAEQWVKIAKAAGMKYMVLTTKHHDGFCMFDTAQTNYSIMNSPYGKDICRQLADACHASGMPLGWYYSPTDWFNPDYMSEHHDRYLAYFRNQLQELLTNYGKISVMWFDGGQRLDGDAVAAMIRKLQPDTLINSRLPPFPGDFDNPEQTIGAYQDKRLWESCITIGNQWSYRPGDTIKSSKTCIQTLVRCVCGDGNLLLNVSPNPLGEIPPDQVKPLREIGAWLKKYGSSVYGTRGGPYLMDRIGGSTRRGNVIYLHIFNLPGDVLSLPAIPAKIKRCKAITGGDVRFSQDAGCVTVTLMPNARNAIDTIVQLTLDSPASKIAPVQVPPITTGEQATASNVYKNLESYGPQMAIDNDLTTRWATDGGVHSAWLAIDMRKNVTVNAARICEGIARIRRFELQYLAGDDWKAFYQGSTIGPDLTITFPPITARRFRLNILEADEGPTLSEFELIEVRDSRT